MRVHRDRVSEYIALRRRTYGFELAPLPQSLPLPTAVTEPKEVVFATEVL